MMLMLYIVAFPIELIHFFLLLPHNKWLQEKFLSFRSLLGSIKDVIGVFSQNFYLAWC